MGFLHYSLRVWNLPVVYHSLSAQFFAKVIKSLFPVKFHDSIRRKKKSKLFTKNILAKIHTS